MHIISPHQLAELLIGIARAQAAIVQSMESPERAVAALQKVNHDRPTLSDLPVQVVLAQLTGSKLSNAAAVAEDLERILGATPGSPGRDLDFGGSPP
jgi:hypothetical protein